MLISNYQPILSVQLGNFFRYVVIFSLYHIASSLLGFLSSSAMLCKCLILFVASGNKMYSVVPLFGVSMTKRWTGIQHRVFILRNWTSFSLWNTFFLRWITSELQWTNQLKRESQCKSSWILGGWYQTIAHSFQTSL